MAREYFWGENPFRDYLVQLTSTGVDISQKDVEKDIFVIFSNILEVLIDKPSDITYLNFDIKENNGYCKIIANNILTALWLSGIFISSTKDILKNNRVELDGQEYIYNKKTKKLNIKSI